MKAIFYPRKIAIILALLFSMLLQACSNLPSMENLTVFSAEEKTQRSCIGKVDAKGRFSIQYKTDEKEESLHGSFDWQQTPDYTILTLVSPLGQTLARIESGPNLTTFIAPGKPPKSAANPEMLIKSELGWSIPVSNLKYWLQGCGLDLQGNPFIASPKSREVITHDGWLIDYSTWIEGPPMTLPKRIDMLKGTRDLKDVEIKLKLIIDEWHF